jgi:hypothetical protein
VLVGTFRTWRDVRLECVMPAKADMVIPGEIRGGVVPRKRPTIATGVYPRATGIQNWNGVTDTEILPSDDCWTVKFTSFEALVSPTVTDIEPLHFNVLLSLLVEVVTIFSPRR